MEAYLESLFLQLHMLHFSWPDLFDIFLVGCLLYLLIQLIRGTRVLPILFGLLGLAALYYLSRYFGMYTLNWLLQYVFKNLFFLLIIIFQKDIRQGLMDIGSHRFLRRKGMQEEAIEAIVEACAEMAEKRVGALIVLQRSVPLRDITEREGVRLDARISRRLLTNIFYPKAPLHDGAVVVRNSRIEAAACILPLAEAKDQTFGTRHRAALGATHESDALVIVVSEERGEISVAEKGILTRKLNAEKLRRILNNAR